MVPGTINSLNQKDVAAAAGSALVILKKQNHTAKKSPTSKYR